MHLEKQFDVERSRDSAAEIAAREETLLDLFPDSKTEIVESSGNRPVPRRASQLAKLREEIFLRDFGEYGGAKVPSNSAHVAGDRGVLIGEVGMTRAGVNDNERETGVGELHVKPLDDLILIVLEID